MKLIIILTFLIFTNPELENLESAADKIQFSGTVIEELTGEPVPGATIYIQETDQEVFTDFDGNFTINDFTPGTYNLEVSFVSFEKEELTELRIDRENSSMLIRLN
jgi:hypothetical protein